MFGILVVLWSLPFLKKAFNQKTLIAITLLVIAYGVVMEFVQKYFTSDRNFDITDIAADIVGALFGLWFIKILIKRISRAKNKPL